MVSPEIPSSGVASVSSSTTGCNTDNRHSLRLVRSRHDLIDEAVAQELGALEQALDKAMLGKKSVAHEKPHETSQTLKKREKDLKKRENDIEKQKIDLEKWENQLKTWGDELEERENQLKEREKLMAEKEENFGREKSRFLDARGVYLDWKEEAEQRRKLMQNLEEGLVNLGLGWVLKTLSFPSVIYK